MPYHRLIDVSWVTPLFRAGVKQASQSASVGRNTTHYHYIIIVHFLVFLKRFSSSFRMMSFPLTRSDDNRRAAGAVNLLAFRIHYEQTKSSGDCRPGGEASLFILCVLWTDFSCPFVSFRGSFNKTVFHVYPFLNPSAKKCSRI